jgi:hypothetical protein
MKAIPTMSFTFIFITLLSCSTQSKREKILSSKIDSLQGELNILKMQNEVERTIQQQRFQSKSDSSVNQRLSDFLGCSIKVIRSKSLLTENFEPYFDLTIENNDRRDVVALEFKFNSERSDFPTVQRKVKIASKTSSNFVLTFEPGIRSAGGPITIHRAIFKNGESCTQNANN